MKYTLLGISEKQSRTLYRVLAFSGEAVAMVDVGLDFIDNKVKAGEFDNVYLEDFSRKIRGKDLELSKFPRCRTNNYGEVHLLNMKNTWAPITRVYNPKNELMGYDVLNYMGQVTFLTPDDLSQNTLLNNKDAEFLSEHSIRDSIIIRFYATEGIKIGNYKYIMHSFIRRSYAGDNFDIRENVDASEIQWCVDIVDPAKYDPNEEILSTLYGFEVGSLANLYRDVTCNTVKINFKSPKVVRYTDVIPDTNKYVKNMDLRDLDPMSIVAIINSNIKHGIERMNYVVCGDDKEYIMEKTSPLVWTQFAYKHKTVQNEDVDGTLAKCNLMGINKYIIFAN